MVNKHSTDWQQVRELLIKERQDAIAALIADQSSDKQRGKIELVQQIINAVEQDNEPLPPADSYN